MKKISVRFQTVRRFQNICLTLSDAIWRHRSRLTSAQVMDCCLTTPRHYLNQCWLIISENYGSYLKVISREMSNISIHDINMHLYNYLQTYVTVMDVVLSGKDYSAIPLKRGQISWKYSQRHPIIRPLGRGMGCLLWVQTLIDILLQFLQWCMQYYIILDRAITAFFIGMNFVISVHTQS